MSKRDVRRPELIDTQLYHGTQVRGVARIRKDNPFELIIVAGQGYFASAVFNDMYISTKQNISISKPIPIRNRAPLIALVLYSWLCHVSPSTLLSFKGRR